MDPRLIDFARSGRLGPTVGGMTLAEAQAVLGPGVPHPAIRMLGPDRADGYPYTFGDVRLEITGGRVTEIRLTVRRNTVARTDFLAALDAAGLPYETYPDLTFGSQNAVQVTTSGVVALFFAAADGTFWLADVFRASRRRRSG